VLVWIVPAIYWTGQRDDDRETWLDAAAHQASYLSMAWVSFILVCTLARDFALFVTAAPPLGGAHEAVARDGVPAALAASLLAMVVGALTALRGPHVKEVLVRIPGLHPDLEGFRIAQVSDLHVGRNIRRAYVERVVERARALTPDLVALTGDMVDGPVERLGADLAPLGALASDGSAFFVLGNHDCYSGAHEWIAHFRRMGLRVLLNEHTLIRKRAATLLVGGVVDPAYRAAGPAISLDDAPKADFRLLLAHNPKLAPLGARAGFDLQLSGHTHAGQFFPWTLAVHLVHAPHVAGLSREGSMWVYVSAGTGTWGPPVRLGTSPEITLIRLAAG
jgi:predicted MPP superfamily phosphohydrolase